MSTNNELRQSLRARRNALSAPEQTQAARRLATLLCAHPLFRASRRIALYFPNDGEIDPTPVLHAAWDRGKRCYLPVLLMLNGNRLRFAPLAPDSELRFNRFGIPEPLLPARALFAATALDLILAPLVAFDAHGHRLGMGGGFYDRSLTFLLHRRHWKRPHLLGLAHDFQRVPQLPAHAWDVPLDGVVTDRAVYPV